jgi:pimeloyl-ACP methyl ester carboxylesterase
MRDMPRVVERPARVKIAYEVVGAGRPLVLLHGLTSSRSAWAPITDLLRSHARCLCIDLRGHGQSSRADDYSMLSMVADVQAVVEEVGGGAPVVVGHSLGATVASVYAAAHPVRAVVCVDQSLRFGDFAALVQARAGALRGDHTLEELMDIEHQLDLGPYDAVDEMRERVLAFPREIVLGVWDAVLTTPPQRLTALAEAVLPRIEAPLLAIHGSQPPADYREWLTGLVPQATVEVWDGLGHMLHLVDPLRFADRLRPLM